LSDVVMRILGALALVWLLAVPATAQPTGLPPGTAEADARWRAAEAELDPDQAAIAWRAAAAAYEAAADAAADGTEAERAAAYAAVLAWRNATAVEPRDDRRPVTPGADDHAALAALDRYLRISRADDPERLAVRFVRGRLLGRLGRVDDAIADFAAIVDQDHRHEYTELAVNLLLDELNRAGRHDDLIAWARRLVSDRALLTAHPTLAPLLQRIDQHGHRRTAEAAARRAAEGDPTGYRACADAYRAALEVDAAGPEAAELSYNRGVCASEAGAVDEAIAALTTAADRDRGALGYHALVRIAGLEQRRGDLHAAAERLDAAADLTTDVRQRRDARLGAIALYLRVGQLAPAVQASAVWLVSALTDPPRPAPMPVAP
jgi:tetratricopeptide (TPR) repeat protein